MTSHAPINVGLIGAGSVVRRIHIPGLELCPGARIVAACDSDLAAARSTGAESVYSDCRELLSNGEIDAVVVATPNHLHHELVLAAVSAGKHVLCEKPLAMNATQAGEMLDAANRAERVHMTAFTYQFTPAVRYARHLISIGAIGEIRTLRAAYMMALSSHLLGWRSSKSLAGSGVLGDIGSHLIHLAQWLAGEVAAVSALERQFRAEPDSDVEDWVAFIARFASGACGTFEISRICPGRGAGIAENMFIEIYGSAGSLIFSLQEPLSLLAVTAEGAGDPGARFETLAVPEQFLKVAGAPRDLGEGDPRWSYRYDQAHWFVENIRRCESRSPSFADGLACQKVIDAVLESSARAAWVTIPG